MTTLACPNRATHFVILISVSPLAWCQGELPPVNVPGRSEQDRVDFLSRLEDDDEYRQRYFELATRDSAWQVRKIGAYMWVGDARTVPILLKIVTSDGHHDVRLSAALNLQCRFTCNGNEHDASDISAFENDLTVLDAAVREESGGRYIIEILDATWCELSLETRKSVDKTLASTLPYGRDTVGINDLAKDVRSRHPVECPNDPRPNKSLDRTRER
jgi:hypothetical protein